MYFNFWASRPVFTNLCIKILLFEDNGRPIFQFHTLEETSTQKWRQLFPRNLGVQDYAMSEPRSHNVSTTYVLVNGTSTNIFSLLFFSVQHTYGCQQDRQCTYKSNIDERSRNHCCRLRAISIMCHECASLVIVTQHAKRMRHIVICGLSVSNTFLHIVS